MTVNTNTNKITYLANGSATVWNFDFPAVDPAFLEVLVTDTQGTTTPIPVAFYSLTMNPPVDPNPTSQGGFVKYPLTGPALAAGNQITIARNLPAIQTVSLSNQSVIYPPVIEQEFDYLTMLNQAGTEEFSRAFRVGPEDPFPALVPSVVQRANHTAFFDSQGNLVGGNIPAPGVFISAVMTPVVQAATLPLARDLMGITAAIQAALQTLFTTGDLKPTHKAVADPGWIMWVDGTIGDDTSGSSILSSTATASALFALYYNNCTDTNCPLLTSVGGATTRAAQGTATAAFAAHCRMTLPKASGRALAMAGTGVGLTARALGFNTGVETTTPTGDTMAPHAHDFSSPYEAHTGPLGTYPNVYNNYLPSGAASFSGVSMNVSGGGLPAQNMPPTTFINVMVKL